MARWTRSELLLALNLYFETPFGKQHKSYPSIIELAERIGRTPSAVGMKLCNFTSLDPVEAARGIVGLSGASKLDREIWNEFEDNREQLVVEIESLLEQQSIQLERAVDSFPTTPTIELDTSIETTRKSLTTQRRHQNFFRRVVLRSYGLKCCITANPIPSLLIASHIIPWSESPSQRLNPRNGLCLSATFDAAFDRGLIGVSGEFRLILSSKIKSYSGNPEIQNTFGAREGMQIVLPEKNLPDPLCLKWHRENIFVS